MDVRGVGERRVRVTEPGRDLVIGYSGARQAVTGSVPYSLVSEAAALQWCLWTGRLQSALLSEALSALARPFSLTELDGGETVTANGPQRTEKCTSNSSLL